jgi:GNAT superfamily N-acetyltransferase
MTVSIDVRAYDPARDEAATFALWQRSLGRTWPLDCCELARMMSDALIASVRGRVAGVAAVARAGRLASLRFLLVHPDLRRHGVGRRLHDAALDHLARQGAQSVNGAIVGTLLATDQRHPQLWRELLGKDSGTIGAVGVAEAARGRGVGTSMVAYACEQLRDRGVRNCHIGWTTELSFYGRLGFQPWRQYETASLEVVYSGSNPSR